MEDDVSNGGTLAILTAMTAERSPRGGFVLTRKFIDGVKAYVERWPGPVRVHVARAERPGANLDHEEVTQADVAFELRWLEPNERELRKALDGSRLALATLVDRHVVLARMGRAIGVPVVYISENSVRTRRQMIRTETGNPLIRWRRELWTTQLERKYQRAVALAAGVQCNGTPTYHAYRSINDNTLLYFDTRVPEELLVDEATLRQRTSKLAQGGPLRLGFSGRLVAIKGADHLPRVAAALDHLGVPFALDICGGGELEAKMKRDVEAMRLGERVRFRGVLDFHRELMPFIAGEIDLFVCCHRQGDPSCTYLETMSCGTPIAGYDNEAFRGLVETSGVGWTSAMDRPELLARRIAELNAQRGSMVDAAFAARTFAAQHTLERTMDARVNHILATARRHESQRRQEAVA